MVYMVYGRMGYIKVKFQFDGWGIPRPSGPRILYAHCYVIVLLALLNRYRNNWSTYWQEVVGADTLVNFWFSLIFFTYSTQNQFTTAVVHPLQEIWCFWTPYYHPIISTHPLLLSRSNANSWIKLAYRQYKTDILYKANYMLTCKKQ